MGRFTCFFSIEISVTNTNDLFQIATIEEGILTSRRDALTSIESVLPEEWLRVITIR